MLPFKTHRFGNKTSVITDGGKEFSYKEIDNLSNSIFNTIQNRCLVFCLCENTIGSLCGYLSFIANKVVPLMLDATINREMLMELIETYKPQYLWMPQYRLEDFNQKQIIHSFSNYSLLKLSEENDFSLHPDLGLLLTTSGSTGSPKLVRLSYLNIEANATSIAEYLSINENERPITTLPMNYSFGLSIINSHLLKGATILLTSKTLMEKDFWLFLKEQKATTMSGVPYTFEILKKLRFFNMDLPCLKTLTQAGGKLNNELNKEFSEFCIRTNKRFFVMYGQTEATARMSYLPPQYSLSKLGSMGIAIPGGEFFLIDEKNQPVEGSEIAGELVYKGKNVSMGYAECGDDLKKQDENNGILYTGDIAKRDQDNFYYIVGRKKRFIKIYGNRVNLDETERLLKNIISDCACVGQDDHMVIFITDKNRTEEVQNFITSKTGINHVAFVVKHINAIPKNSSGKTIYSKLSF
ncbi:MAG TPA: AMP-binding protein [Bacteroidales bacterium]|nr:AMP-binding protein [Bacteroidales bacterium]HQP14610.1 AMP-binding protein [Bacteroidales bacterium]